MKNLSVLTAILLCFSYNSFSQQPTTKTPAKIGGAYYTNCKHILVFEKQDVLNIIERPDSSMKIDFDIFNEQGKKVATVTDNKISSGEKDLFAIKSSTREFSCIEKSTQRIICLVKKVPDTKSRRTEMNVWVDMYMPSGFYFQCTPETTNVPFLNNMRGASFSNSNCAIHLN